MAVSPPQVLIDGTWLTALTSWGDLKITDRWPGGNWEASWTIPTYRLRRFQQMRPRASAQVRVGGASIWVGYLTEPNWDTGEMVAVGNARRGEEALCLVNATSDSTSTPDTAIDDSVTRGALNWIRRSSISAVPFGSEDETDSLNYVAALMDAYCKKAGVGWGVNALGEVFTAALPMTPTLRVTPNSGALGVADEALASRVFGRYTPTSGSTGIISIGAGAPEIQADLRPYGAMDSTKATSITTDVYNQLGALTGWTNGLSLSAGQIANMGGANVGLATVSAGARGPVMMRLDGLRDERGVATSTDIVLGETVWDVTAGTVQCNPMGLAARDLAAIIEGAAGPVPQ